MSTWNRPSPVAVGGVAGAGGTTARAFLTEVRNEMRRVTWPSRREVYATTIVVILTVGVLRRLHLGLDLVLRTIVNGIFRTVWCRMTDVATRNWYIVHTYSGFENKVKESLQQRVQAYGLQDEIGEVLIPTEDIVEKRGGREVKSARRFFPGYILVEMTMSDHAWHVVKNTPKVTGFVGAGTKPTPLSKEEVDHILEQVKRRPRSRSRSTRSRRAITCASTRGRSPASTGWSTR
jgi:transcription termination/antitermination factor NusG/preprotein translocase SecE subunit